MVKNRGTALIATTLLVCFSTALFLRANHDHDSSALKTLFRKAIVKCKSDCISLFENNIDPNEPLDKSVTLPEELFLVKLRARANNFSHYPVIWLDSTVNYNAETPLVHAAASLKSDPQGTVFEKLIEQGAYEGYFTATHLALLYYTQNPVINLKKIISYFPELSKEHWYTGDDAPAYRKLFMTFLLKELFRLGENLTIDQRNDMTTFLMRHGAHTNQAKIWDAVGKREAGIVKSFLNKEQQQDQLFIRAILYEAIALQDVACVEAITDHLQDYKSYLESPYYYYHESYPSELLYDSAYAPNFSASILYLSAQLDDENYTITSQLARKFSFTEEQLLDAQRSAARSIVAFGQAKDFGKLLKLVAGATHSLGNIGEVLHEAFFIDAGKELRKLYMGEGDVDFIKAKEQLKASLYLLSAYVRMASQHPELDGDTDFERLVCIRHYNEVYKKLSDYELLWDLTGNIIEMITGGDTTNERYRGGYMSPETYKTSSDSYKFIIDELLGFALSEFRKEILPYIPESLQETFVKKERRFLHQEELPEEVVKDAQEVTTAHDAETIHKSQSTSFMSGVMNRVRKVFAKD